jgi:hypothetical protein
MKNFVFYGDGLLCPPEGYSEQIVDGLVLRHPEAAFQSFHPGEQNLTLEAAFKGAPFHIIGKAPDLVFLGVGSVDVLQSAEPSAMLANLEALLQLIQQKTRASIAFTSVCEAFLPEESLRERARAYNAGLPALGRSQERLIFLDLNAEVNAFLARHRQGAGEKRALHVLPLRLTSMGRVFLSHTVLENLPWNSFLPAKTL